MPYQKQAKAPVGPDAFDSYTLTHRMPNMADDYSKPRASASEYDRISAQLIEECEND